MASSCINTTEYMYCSSRIRSLEAHIVGNEGLNALSECATLEDVVSKLSEYDINIIRGEDGSFDAEATLQGILNDAFRIVKDNVPCPENYDFIRYKYDCNNLKAAVKCNIRGISPASMLYNCGSVEMSKVSDAISADVSAYPKHMAEAISIATDTFAKTGNPQTIDIILDRACFADMLENARNSRIDLSEKLVRTKINLINIMMCIRLIRMKTGDAGKMLLRDALLDGGDFETGFYRESYEGGQSKLLEMLEFTSYGKFASSVLECDGALSQIERIADDFYMDVAKSAKMVPFGPEVVVGYLVACEYEVNNLRIVFNAKRSGSSSEVIRERLRSSYV